jgi:hypothetical protein
LRHHPEGTHKLRWPDGQRAEHSPTVECGETRMGLGQFGTSASEICDQIIDE